MSLFDARIRTLDNKNYVKEIHFTNFGDRIWEKDIVGFREDVFKDDGKGYDVEASDGIFTSTKSFEHNEEVPFIKKFNSISVLSNPIVNSEFINHQELKDFYKTLNLENQDQSTIEITCDMYFCEADCLAHILTGCGCCICLRDCSITIGF